MGVQIVYAPHSHSHPFSLSLYLTPIGAIINKLSQAVTDAFNLLLELFMTNDWARKGIGRWSGEGWDDRKAVIVKFISADEPAAGQKGCDSGWHQ